MKDSLNTDNLLAKHFPASAPALVLAATLVLLLFIVNGCHGRADRAKPSDETHRTEQIESAVIGGRDYTIEWLEDETFDRADWASRWTVESQTPSVTVQDGKLIVRRNGASRDSAGTTVWYNSDLPPDVLILVDATTQPGDHACNLNFFLHASEADGSPLRYGRSGNYPDYHQIPNYIFTFTGGFQSGWSRLRKNPGFELLHEVDSVRTEPNRAYEIAIVLWKGELRFAVDGKLIHNIVDPEPLDGGRFGLRTWFSDVDYERVRIGRIVEDVPM